MIFYIRLTQPRTSIFRLLKKLSRTVEVANFSVFEMESNMYVLGLGWKASSRLAVARVAAGFRGADRRERWSLRFDGDFCGFPSCATLRDKVICPRFAPHLCSR